MWKGVLVFAGPLGLTGAQDALYRNEGDGTFRNVTGQTQVQQAEPTYGLAALFCDYDRDGDPDLYVANDSAPNFLYRNEGGTFRDIGVAAGVALSAEGVAQAGMGIAYGDYDRDGFGDFLVTHFEDDYNTLYRNRPRPVPLPWPALRPASPSRACPTWPLARAFSITTTTKTKTSSSPTVTSIPKYDT